MSNIPEIKLICNKWTFIGEDTRGFVFLCTKCGAIKSENGKFLSGPVSEIDINSLDCPEQTG